MNYCKIIPSNFWKLERDKEMKNYEVGVKITAMWVNYAGNKVKIKRLS